MIEADGEELQALVIPPGVAHGFYFPRPSLHAYAVSHYWNPLDELGCRFDDPELGITWPDPNPTLSERDKTLPPLAVLLRSLEAWRPADPWKN
jgi:dTDP-4-dehydrorhamnose 3,5-epimerase